MKEHLKKIVISLAAVGSMGIAMPQCPGQQEMQQKMDMIQVSNAELGRKVQKLESQVSTIDADMAQVKQLLPQMTNVIQAQKGALDQVAAQIKDVQEKMNKSSKKKHKAASDAHKPH